MSYKSLVQASTDLAIAQKFAMMLRHGDIGGQKFSKIVGVGHSYGSVQTQALSATLPQALDAVILQGFSGTFNSNSAGFFFTNKTIYSL